MTLADALAHVAPIYEGLTRDETDCRGTAAVVVYGALTSLASRVLRGMDQEGDIVGQLFVRLMSAGPKRRPMDSDEGARRYLLRSLRNAKIDHHRQRSNRHDSLTDDDGATRDIPDTSMTDPEAMAAAKDDVARLAGAEAALYQRAVPAVAARLRDAQAFVRNVQDIRGLAREQCTMEDLVRREDPDPLVFKQVRDRLYQRHKRTRTHLFETLPAWLSTSGLPEAEQAMLARLAEHDFAVRHARKDGR